MPSPPPLKGIARALPDHCLPLIEPTLLVERIGARRVRYAARSALLVGLSSCTDLRWWLQEQEDEPLEMSGIET